MTDHAEQPARRPVVVLRPPPCERSFSLQFNANGELRSVEIDGVNYATVRRKRTTLVRPGDWIVTVVDIQYPD